MFTNQTANNTSPVHRAPAPNATRYSHAMIVLAAAAVMIAPVLREGSAAASPQTAARAHHWVIEATPNPSGAQFSFLHGISCTTASSCTAAGTYLTSSGNAATLGEYWDGSTWAIQPTPNQSGVSGSFLNAISCSAAASCIAVGSAGLTATGYDDALAEYWDGSTWAILTSPNPPGALGSTLTAVSCRSATSCTAVGSYITAQDASMLLAEHWNGSTWALQALSLPPGASGSLAGVSCRSAANCTAVGQYQSNTAGGVLAEAWNGSTWTMQATPSPTGAIDSQLNAISCPSASSCTAAGLYSTTSSTFPLAETWNGSTWTIQATPSPAGATAGSYLSSLSCTSAGNCTAVGQYDKKLGPVFPLAEHWNGSTWAIQTTPVPTGAASSQLNAVACNSGCTAVGTYSPSQTANLTLAEHK